MYSGVVMTKAKLMVKRVSKPRRAANPKRLAEDEADYRSSQKSIQSGRPVSLSKVLKELVGSIESIKRFWLPGFDHGTRTPIAAFPSARTPAKKPAAAKKGCPTSLL